VRARLANLFLHLAAPFSRLSRGRWRRQPAAFLAGTLARPWKLRPGTRVFTLGVRFRPAGFTRAFAIDMSTTTDREVPLETLVPRETVDDLLAILRGSLNERRAIAALQSWLLAHVRVRPGADPLAPRAVRAVLASGGRLRVSELAEQMNISRRQLERVFARHLGVRPKLLARIVRLQAALAQFGEHDRGPAGGCL